MRKKKEDKAEKEAPPEFKLKYPKPKILLIDLPDTALEKLQAAGFNAKAGTFGFPYKVEISNAYQPVIAQAYLPNYTEQEIIIIDLTPPGVLNDPKGEKMTPEEEEDWWAKCNRGKIDPRPMIMYQVRDVSDRILKHGGLFVIFAEPRLYQDIKCGYKGGHGRFVSIREIKADNWSFLSILSPGHFEIESDVGEEIDVPDDDYQIYRFLRDFIKNSTFKATFEPRYELKTNWRPLLSNKYGKDVAGLIVPKDSKGEYTKGRIFILPQIAKKPEAVLTLLREILPEASPHLFPHVEGARWVERDEYELESILNFKDQKNEVRQRAKREIEEIDQKIVGERNKLGFLHGMLTKTGDNLVSDVKTCLEYIGFEQVRDVDREIKHKSQTSRKQEDLQIHDRSPILLLEVKGLSGLPRESDILQVVKYIPRRSKEWHRTDIRGVSIINHQRNLPALERGNENVFSPQQIEDAQNHEITILTTWDLFLLVRGMIKWKWDASNIRQLFYKDGRMPRIPANYKPVGEVDHYWEEPGVVGIQISEGKIIKGQRIAYITKSDYLEEDVQSLQVGKQDVEEAAKGQLACIKTEYKKGQLSKGSIVHMILKKQYP